MKQWRSKGIGTALLHTLIEWTEANPFIEKLGLGVFITNEKAIRLYRKLGFMEEGWRPKELKLSPEHYMDDISMYRFV